MSKNKIGIIGSRFDIVDDRYKTLYFPPILICLKKINFDNIEIVSGGARGIDKVAELFAFEYDIDLKVFYANWDKHGKSAGMIRNKELITYCDKVIIFWDGQSKGTKNSFDLIKKHKKPFRLFDMKANFIMFDNYEENN